MSDPVDALLQEGEDLDDTQVVDSGPAEADVQLDIAQLRQELGLDESSDFSPPDVKHGPNANAADQADRENDAHARAEMPRLPKPVHDLHELARLDTDDLYKAQEAMGPSAMSNLLKQIGATDIHGVPEGIKRKQKVAASELQI